MSSYPYSGRVPLNLIQDKDKLEKAVSYKDTSYREVRSHPNTTIQPMDKTRNDGNTPLRRYPDGKLDIHYVASFIIDVIHKMQNKGYLTEFEKALLTVVLPTQFSSMNPGIANTMARVSDEEKMKLALEVTRHFNEELNWNAGRGGGSVPFRHATKS